MLREYKGKWPEVHQTVFVDESAQVVGDVRIGKDSSVWHNAVIRGDVNHIRIGERTNMQDGVVLHGTLGLYPVILEDNITVGHNAVVHGCTVHSNCLIGISAIILDNADIGKNCIIGAGAIVTEGMRIPPDSLVIGIPGRIKRRLSAQEIQSLTERATRYVEYKDTYLAAILNQKEVSSL
ncbi:MAG: gamma carbonic anhydrase family protein [bacterium]|nr:gamma carbonic anhydrase family protein [bacterium]